jgi:hypothetical protein
VDNFFFFYILIWFHQCDTVTTGLIEAACERTVVSKSKENANLTNGIHEPHSPTLKAQNGNGLKSSNGSLNVVCPNSSLNMEEGV